jgi:hypothetical protein
MHHFKRPSFPREVWEIIFSGLKSQDLRAVSLTCGFFKDIAQPLLFSNIKLCAGVIAVIDKSKHCLWYSYPEHSDRAADALQQLRFVASPVISNRIRTCKLEYEQRTFGQTGPGIDTPMECKGYWMLDQVTIALSNLKLARWESLELHRLPILHRHLQSLLPTFSHTHINFRDCWTVDPELGFISLPFNSVTLSYPRNFDRSHGRILLTKSILTHALVHLDIRGLLLNDSHRHGVAWMLGVQAPLPALESLSMSEQHLDYMIPFLYLFSNISSLSITPRIASPRTPPGIPSDSFPQLLVLECPVYLLSEFNNHPIRELRLVVLFPRFRYSIWPQEKHVVNQNSRLLSQISTLKLIHVTALDNILEEFLSHCHNVRTLSVDLNDPLRPSDISWARVDIESDTQVNPSTRFFCTSGLC